MEHESKEFLNIRTIEALVKATRAIFAESDFKGAARAIFAQCIKILGATGGYVELMAGEEDKSEVIFLELDGFPCNLPTDLPIPIRGLRGQSYERGVVLYDNDFANSESMKYIPAGHVPLESVMIVPLNFNGKTKGLMGLANKPGGFTNDDLRIAALFGDYAALALRDAQWQEAIEDRERKYRSLFESSPHAIVLFDALGNIIDCNPECTNITGFERDDLVGKNYAELGNMLTNAQMSFMHEKYSMIHQEKDGISFEHTVLDKSGKIHWFDTRVTPLTTANNELYFQAIAVDITERKHAVESLRTMADMLDEAPNAITVHDFQGNFFYANRKTFELHGYGKDEFMAMTMSDIDAPESNAQFNNRGKLLKQNGEARFEVCHFHKNGDIIPLEVFVKKVEWDGIPAVLSIASDITERKLSEEMLKEQEERMRLAIRGGDLGTWDWDIPSGKVINNKRWAEMAGYSIDETQQHTDDWDHLTHPDDVLMVKKALEDHIQGRTPQYEIEHRMWHKDGHWIWVLDKGEVIERDEQGRALRMIGTHLDITDRKRAEQEKAELQAQLFQSQKMDAVGQLAGGVAHDFNNMLGIIMSAADLARMDLEEDAPAHEELRTITDAVRKARALTLKLLTFARKDKIETRSVQASEIIDNLRGMLSRTVSKNVELKFMVQDDIPVFCDQNQIHQALLNVCNNAMDAMPAGGNLTLEAKRTELPQGICEECRKEFSGPHCMFLISDTGVGIDAKIIKRVTEPFFTTKGVGKGTGLGLSVTHGIVTAHKGHLYIQSEPGKGTNVKIYLPLDQEPQHIKKRSKDTQPLHGAETILIVDDEKSLLKLAGKLLKKIGYEPLLAENGEQALELYRKQGHKIAAVILDLIMPGMDGSQVSEELERLNPDVKIVFASGYSQDGVAGRLLKNEKRRFVQKPFEFKVLGRTIRELLDVDEP